MSAPKSVIKIKNGGVEYISSCDQAEYYLFELTRAALRDVGKFVSKKFRDEYYCNFGKNTGDAGKATKYNVWSSKNTQYPRVQIGLKPPKGKGFYSYFQEFGSSKTPRLGLLSKTVESNIAEIVKIESQYLSSLSDEASRLEHLVDEKEYEGDADEQD